MGWAGIHPTTTARLFDIGSEFRFYFTHSYKLCCENRADIAATYEFDEAVVCAVQHDNIYGVQFHPEKSHRFGMKLLRNFIERTR